MDDAQLEQLKAEGCAKIYREKASGARADRRELLRMLKAIGSGDVVTVTRIAYRPGRLRRASDAAAEAEPLGRALRASSEDHERYREPFRQPTRLTN